MTLTLRYVGLCALVTFVVSAESAPEHESYTTEAKVIRVALVVGAQNYRYLPPVDNAWTDAQAMEETLAEAEFDSVLPLRDPPTKDVVTDHIKELVTRAGPADQAAIIIVFFAGHGFQHGEWNYIVPTEAEKGPQMLEQSVPVFTIIKDLTKHRAGLSIFLFDSCRTGISVTRPASTDAAEITPVGFTTVAAPKRAVVSLAAAYGKAARSAATGETNSPYTAAMRHYLPVAAQPLPLAFENVRDYVVALTGGRQSPFIVADANMQRFYLHPTQPELDDDKRAWQAVLQTGRTECVEKYISDRPGSRFLAAALAWLTDPSRPEPRPKEIVTCPH